MMFEIYPGNHVSGIADRMETKTLPFFSKNLVFRFTGPIRL